MEYAQLFEAIHRHLDETKLIIDQLVDEALYEEPVLNGRSLGEVVLHLIRSLEYYSQGLSRHVWNPLNYTLDKYPSAGGIKSLFAEVMVKTKTYLSEIDQGSLQENYEAGNRPAKRVDVLLEMLEHSIQHRGQILVYYRLLGIEPAKIPYII